MSEHQVNVVDTVDHTTPLNALGTEAHLNAQSKGFYDPMPKASLELGQRLMQAIALHCDALDAHRKNTDITAFDTLGKLPDDLTPDEQRALMALLLIISEAIETAATIITNGEHEIEHEAEELADILIRLVDFAAWRGIDLDAAVVAKMAVNKDRPYKHGKKF